MNTDMFDLYSKTSQNEQLINQDTQYSLKLSSVLWMYPYSFVKNFYVTSGKIGRKRNPHNTIIKYYPTYNNTPENPKKYARFCHQNLLKYKPWTDLNDIFFKVDKQNTYITQWKEYLDSDTSTDPSFIFYRNALKMEQAYQQDLENMSEDKKHLELQKEDDDKFMDPQDAEAEGMKVIEFQYDIMYSEYLSEM